MRTKSVFLPLLMVAACSSADESAGNIQDVPAPAAATPENAASAADGQPNSDVPLGTAPELQHAEARMSGRYGTDLYLALEGTDNDANAVALWLEFLDSRGQAILRVDSDRDGMPDVAEQVVPFDEPIHGLPTFTAHFTEVAFFSNAGDVAQVKVALQDEEGLRSQFRTLDFVQQPVLGFGEPCDSTYRMDRCEPGMGCRGEPSTCLEGVPPIIDRFAYLSDFGTPRILIEGHEPDDDMQMVLLEFLDAADGSVFIDIDGDGTTDTATYEAFPRENRNGEFFISLYPVDSFAETVTRIAATPFDAYGNQGERVVTDIAPILERDWNQGCDPRGFDMCTHLATCIPGIPGASNKCGAPNRARQDQCADAVTLYAPDDNLRFFGRANGASLWNPSAGCVTEFGLDGPEEIVLLELSRGVPSLTLSTDFPNTDFDTVLYVMEGICPAPDAQDIYLGCVDDTMTSLRSTLTLTNVPAGDYLVVIDSWDAQGGNFQLSVSTD